MAFFNVCYNLMTQITDNPDSSDVLGSAVFHGKTGLTLGNRAKLANTCKNAGRVFRSDLLIIVGVKNTLVCCISCIWNVFFFISTRKEISVQIDYVMQDEGKNQTNIWYVAIFCETLW